MMIAPGVYRLTVDLNWFGLCCTLDYCSLATYAIFPSEFIFEIGLCRIKWSFTLSLTNACGICIMMTFLVWRLNGFETIS